MINPKIKNLDKNILTIENLDQVNPLLYTIMYLNIDTVTSFIPINGYNIFPTKPIAPGASTTVDLVIDNVYKITFADTVNVDYYIITDYNLRECRKKYIKNILCPPQDPCLDPCITTYDYMRFKVIENNVYFIWNKWVQSQSLTDLITPPDNEMKSESEWLNMLSEYCDNCQVLNNSSSLKSNCGC